MSVTYQKPIERYIAGIFFYVLLFISGQATLAQPGPSFQGIGPVPNPNPSFHHHSRIKSLSANGLVVTGFTSGVVVVEEAFRWTRESGMLLLGNLGEVVYTHARAVSGDGLVVVGVVRALDEHRTHRAFRWTLSEGMVFLGDLPGGGHDFSFANSVSADGTVIVGHSISANSLLKNCLTRMV